MGFTYGIYMSSRLLKILKIYLEQLSIIMFIPE